MKCIECGGNLKVTSSEEVCTKCGLIEDVIFQGEFNSNIPASTSGKIVKDVWLISSREKNLLKARRMLDFLKGRLNLPRYIIDQTFNLYSEAVHKGLCPGRSNNSILLACLYSVCLQNNISKTAVEITNYSSTDSYELLRMYRFLRKRLNLKSMYTEPLDLIPRYCTNLSLSENVLNTSMELVEMIIGSRVYSGKNPKSIAAACIYLGAKLNNEKVTQRALANMIGVLETTIRKRYKEIEEHIKHLDS